MEVWGPKSSQWGMLQGLAALSAALLWEPQKSPDDAAIIPLKVELKSYRELQDFYDKTSFQSTNLPFLTLSFFLDCH